MLLRRIMFSVVIPAYNCENTIIKCLESILNQTRIDLIDEIIIVNDGSKDNSDGVIRNFISLNKQYSFAYYSQNNQGASLARNIGINMAKSEWIALIDSDDAWNDSKIEKQYNIIVNNKKCVFLGSDISIKGKVGSVYKLNPYQLCIKSTPTTPSVIFKKNVGVELGLFNINMKYSEDINFFQKFFKYDSYYILKDDLVVIGSQKQHFGQLGLSSNLKQMAIGRDKNVVELYKMGYIDLFYMILMLLFNKIKYIRRLFINVLMLRLNLIIKMNIKNIKI